MSPLPPPLPSPGAPEELPEGTGGRAGAQPGLGGGGREGARAQRVLARFAPDAAQRRLRPGRGGGRPGWWRGASGWRAAPGAGLARGLPSPRLESGFPSLSALPTGAFPQPPASREGASRTLNPVICGRSQGARHRCSASGQRDAAMNRTGSLLWAREAHSLLGRRTHYGTTRGSLGSARSGRQEIKMGALKVECRPPAPAGWSCLAQCPQERAGKEPWTQKAG